MASKSKSVRKTNTNKRKKAANVNMAGQPQPQPEPTADELEQAAFERAFPEEAAAAKAAEADLNDTPFDVDDDAQTSLEIIYGKRGVPDDSPLAASIREQTIGTPPLDALGRKPKDKETKQYDLLPKHRVTLVREAALEYPEMYLKIFVTGPEIDQRGFPLMFAKSHCFKADSLDECDLVVFTGGADVNPMLYGENAHPYTSWDDGRDLAEMELYSECLDKGIPMFGVCRGAQFLHVMNGGKLYQHIDGHQGDHPLFDISRRKRIERVSSVHHQSVIKNDDMEVIAVCSESKRRHFNDKTFEDCKRNDIEAFFYRDTCCIGVQGHPEYRNYDHFTQWALELIYEYVVLNPDLTWVDKVRRMTPDALALRDQKWKSIIATHFEKGK